MELRQLVTFQMVATTLNFIRAADALSYAQSSVTAHIQALEEELGVQLFDRLGKQIMLTDAGLRLLGYAERLLNLAAEAHSAVSSGDEPRGVLTISAPETLCTYRLPHVFQQFRARFPQVRLIFRSIPVADLRRSVSEGVVDVAFVLEEPLQATNLIVEPLVSEPLLILAPPDHPLAQSSCVRPCDLEGEPVLLTVVGSCSYRNRFKHALSAVGVYPTINLELSSIEAIKQCVMVGMGITVLPAIAVATEVAQGRLVALRWVEQDFQVITQMIWHKEKWVSPTLNAFLDVAREVFNTAKEKAATT